MFPQHTGWSHNKSYLAIECQDVKKHYSIINCQKLSSSLKQYKYLLLNICRLEVYHKIETTMFSDLHYSLEALGKHMCSHVRMCLEESSFALWHFILIPSFLDCMVLGKWPGSFLSHPLATLGTAFSP